MTATASVTARATQTVLTGIEVDSLVNSTKEVAELRQRCVQLEQDNSVLRAEKKELSEKITVLIETFFKDDDEKVKFYTGLTNWNLLLIVIQFVQPFLKHCCTLTTFQQIILALMRLRLGLSGQDIGYTQIWYSPLYCISHILRCY